MDIIFGLLFVLILSIPAYFLGKMFPLVGAPVFSIAIGMLIHNFFNLHPKLISGIKFSSKKVLQYAVILLGFGLNMNTVLSVGTTSLPIIISTIFISLLVSYICYKKMNINKNIAILVGVGSSICGGSAIAAAAPVINASDDDIAESISVIFLFNIIAAIIFPSIGRLLHFSNEGFALFAGIAVNDTSSVTAVASVWDSIHNLGNYVLNQATIVKLTRTLAIIPICLGLLFIKKRENKNHEHSIKKIFPMFIIYFLLASVFTTVIEYLISNSYLSAEYGMYFEKIFSYLKWLSKFFIVMAMMAIGLGTNVKKLISKGKQAILIGGLCWISIILTSIVLQKVLGIF